MATRKRNTKTTRADKSTTFAATGDATVTVTETETTQTVTIGASASSGGVSDGDKGDITVSGSGTTWSIDADAVTYAKMQNASAADVLLGRGNGGAGNLQEITLGTNLSMSGTTLNASGGSSGLTHPQILARGLGA